MRVNEHRGVLEGRGDVEPEGYPQPGRHFTTTPGYQLTCLKPHIAARFLESVQMIWLIWSLEHRGWRKPAGWGYTTATNRAGFFTEVEAKDIVDRANSAVRPGEFLKEIMIPAPAKDTVKTDFKKENTIWSGALAGEICHCGNPAEHLIEEMVPLDDRNPHRTPLKAFLCNNHFREIMGPGAWL